MIITIFVYLYLSCVHINDKNEAACSPSSGRLIALIAQNPKAPRVVDLAIEASLNYSL